MAKFKDTLGNVYEIGSPELNSALTAGKTRVPDTTPLSSDIITSDSLKPSPEIAVKTPETPSVPSVAGFEIPTTPTIDKSQENIKEIEKINQMLAQESAFRTEQEASVGIPEFQKSMDDLGLRLRDLQRQEKAIPIQIQKEFEGRGVTKGGIAPIEAGRLRENAIEALTVSSLIDASNLNLTSAMRKVDRAVEQKFGQAKAEKNALIENLELLIKSGQLTREETRRAEAQKAVQEAKKQEIENKEKEQKEIWDLTVKYAPDISKLPNGSVVLEQMRTAKTKGEALAIVSASGALKKDTKFSDPYLLGGDYVQKNLETGEIRTAVNVAKGTGGEISVFTSTQLNKGASNAGLSVKEFNQLEENIKNFYINSTQEELEGIQEAIDNVKNGKENVEDVKIEINNSNLPLSVKEYLKQKIDGVTPQKSTESWWTRIKNWFIGK